MRRTAAHEATKQRLLFAAGEEFARVGFGAASVRAIVDAADANVSAVKYHYGSKEDLYLAVWEFAAKQMVSDEPMPRVESFDDPREALRAFIAWFMRLVLTESEEHPWAGQLLAHETVSPPPGALDTIVANCAGPIKDEDRQGDHRPPRPRQDARRSRVRGGRVVREPEALARDPDQARSSAAHDAGRD